MSDSTSARKWTSPFVKTCKGSSFRREGADYIPAALPLRAVGDWENSLSSRSEDAWRADRDAATHAG